MDFQKMAEGILKHVGGKENIQSFTHCATRLRLTLRDESLADEKTIQGIQGVLGIARSGGQFQIIIGNEVPKAYAALQALVGNVSSSAGDAPKTKKKVSEYIFDFVSSVFTPVLPAIIGAGLIKSVLAFAVLVGMDTTSETYTFINLIGDAPLYFLPVMLAFTGAKKLGCNPFLAVSIAGALLHPNYTAMITDAYNIHFSSMFGLPVTLASYNSSVIPVVLMLFALYFAEKACDRWIPKMVRFFFKPLVCILFVSALTFIVLGPIGFVVGVGISNILNFLDSHVSFLVPTIIGCIFPLMVTTGMHYGLVPFMMQSLAAQGYETLCGPGNLPSNIAQGAASLAVAIKTKNSELKQTAFTTGATALLGITEPAMFAVTLKFKKVLASVMIGGGLGGFYAGIMGVRCFSFCSPGLLSLVAYIGPDGWGNLIHSCIAMAISFVSTFILVTVWGFKDEKKEEGSASDSEQPSGAQTLMSPVQGEAVSISEVPDPTFAQEMMGKGIAFKPVSGTFCSPINGKVTFVFPSKHAVGLQSDDGAEILIHIGLDTVSLDGKPFTVFVKDGQSVKIGDKLIEADLQSIEAAGLQTITPMIVTNSAQYQTFKNHLGPVKVSDPALDIE